MILSHVARLMHCAARLWFVHGSKFSAAHGAWDVARDVVGCCADVMDLPLLISPLHTGLGLRKKRRKKKKRGVVKKKEQRGVDQEVVLQQLTVGPLAHDQKRSHARPGAKGKGSTGSKGKEKPPKPPMSKKDAMVAALAAQMGLGPLAGTVGAVQGIFGPEAAAAVAAVAAKKKKKKVRRKKKGSSKAAMRVLDPAAYLASGELGAAGRM